jgi:predicted nuclease of predicted toxin-antitoxin system
MALRFFTDHCVPNSVGAVLSQDGHVVFRLRDNLPTNSPDPVVIAKAQELNAVLLSLNGDFADIVTYPPAQYNGIISLQLRNHPEVMTPVLERLTEYLANHPDAAHYEGKLLLVEPHRIRVRS